MKGRVLTIVVTYIVLNATIRNADGAAVEVASEEQKAKEYMQHLNDELAHLSNQLAKCQFAHETNLNAKDLEDKYLEAADRLSEYSLGAWKKTTSFNHETFSDKYLRRQFEKVRVSRSHHCDNFVA